MKKNRSKRILFSALVVCVLFILVIFIWYSGMNENELRTGISSGYDFSSFIKDNLYMEISILIILTCTSVIINSAIYRMESRNMAEKSALESEISAQRKINETKDELLWINDMLVYAKAGLWIIEAEEGKEPLLRGDRSMKMLIGAPEDATPEECYKAWWNGVPDEEKELVLKGVEDMRTIGQAEVFYPWHYPDGERIYVRCVGSPNKDFKGKGYSLVGYHQDVTGMYTTQLEKERYLKTLSDTYFVTAHFDLVNDRRIVLNSGSYTDEYVDNASVGVKEAIDLWAENDLDPEDRAANEDFWDIPTMKERLKKNNTITREVKTISNGWICIQLVASGRDEEGNVTDVTWLARRIDEQKQKELEMQAELETAYKEANRANAAKSDFLSAMSHDIRTPMNAIKGMTDIALRNIDDKKKVEDCLGKIRVSGSQLVALVNDILDISAIENNKITLRETELDVVAGFESVKNIFSLQNVSKSQDGEYNIHDISSRWVKADEVRVSQIFTNLVGNAVKYTPEGGKVSFEMYQETGADGTLNTVGIVEDSGIGMSEEFMENMWESFNRAVDTRVNKIQGTGLGLAIVKNLVSLMNGTIEVQSELNKGSRFKVTLPLKPVYHEEKEEEKECGSFEQLNVHALVAEDNEVNWEIINELLTLNGIISEHACDGEECLKKFTEAPPKTYDVIFMDMQMPYMNGIEATKAIRASEHPEAKTIPIIAMTANAFTEDAEKCKAAGMNDHLAKPIEMEEVLAAIKKYVI